MKLQIQINLNDSLYLRNPEQSELGKKIIQHSVILIYQYGFESFTFKKLATEINTTEAGVYRYFENKHRLLLYLVDWYWSWVQYQINFHTNNIEDPELRLRKVIKLLATKVNDDESTSYINENLLQQIIISEGSKAYLTKQVGEDNKLQFFKPFKDLSATIGKIITEIYSEYNYPKSLATTILEMAHLQIYFMYNLPSLTDFGSSKNEEEVVKFLEQLVFSAIKKN